MPGKGRRQECVRRGQMGASTEKELQKAVVRAKLTQPALPIGYVGRAALLKRLELLARQKLTLVAAPTGYGKTGLMVEFARKKAEEGTLVSWLTVDEEDADFARFCRHIVAALAGLGAQVAAEIEPLVDEELLERGAGLDDGVLVAMGNALFEALPPGLPCYLLIDDYGCADQQGRDVQLLRFCSLTPPDFHVVLASSAFSWVLQTDAYRLGYGCLGVEDLALTIDEARHLANAMCDEPPSDEALEKACRFVEGWPQGLVLAARSLSGARSADDVRLDGSLLNVRRYFQAQVTRLVTGDLFSFMLEISVLETFSRPLCEAVFGSGSTQALLDELIRRNLFVVPCDEEGTWFRFNALFADWLRSELLQLRIEEIRQTCARASEWFHDYGMQDEAAKYLLLASDFDYVANLTGATCSLSRSDKRTHYLLWLCRIPSAEFASSPLLCMLSAWSCITNARVADAQNWIARFERSMQEPAHAGSLDPSIVEFSSKCLKMKCVAMEGDGQEALAQCDELLNSGYEIKPSLMSMIYQSLGEAYERIGDMAQAQEIYLQAQASASVDATMHQLLFNSFSFAEVQHCFGELAEARESCEKLLQTCPSDFALYGAICALLARVLLERNEKERASVLVERSLKRTSHYRHIDMYLEAKMAQAGLLAARGSLSEAYEVIVEGILHGEQKDVPRAVLLRAYFQQAEIAARRRNLRDLLLIERKFAARVHEGDVYCQLLLSLVRALSAWEKGDGPTVLETLESVEVHARKGRYVCLLVKALAVETVVLREIGEGSRACAQLKELLTLASRYGFMRSLLDAGEPLRDLLRDYSTTRKAGASVRSYVKSLLVEFERELPEAPSGIDGPGAFANDGPDPLTPRELEILKLLNMGLSRKEISETLCISVNTAKKHLANIYSKLGVGTREEALREYAANRSVGNGASGSVAAARE